MSSQNEPTQDEIVASIRRFLNEPDAQPNQISLQPSVFARMKQRAYSLAGSLAKNFKLGEYHIRRIGFGLVDSIKDRACAFASEHDFHPAWFFATPFVIIGAIIIGAILLATAALWVSLLVIAAAFFVIFIILALINRIIPSNLGIIAFSYGLRIKSGPAYFILSLILIFRGLFGFLVNRGGAVFMGVVVLLVLGFVAYVVGPDPNTKIGPLETIGFLILAVFVGEIARSIRNKFWN